MTEEERIEIEEDMVLSAKERLEIIANTKFDRHAPTIDSIPQLISDLKELGYCLISSTHEDEYQCSYAFHDSQTSADLELHINGVDHSVRVVGHGMTKTDECGCNNCDIETYLVMAYG